MSGRFGGKYDLIKTSFSSIEEKECHYLVKMYCNGGVNWIGDMQCYSWTRGRVLGDSVACSVGIVGDVAEGEKEVS